VLSTFVRQKLRAFVVKENAAEPLAMNELVAAGRVTPVLGPAFPLADGAAAIAAFEAPHLTFVSCEHGRERTADLPPVAPARHAR
jgi:hypothetical protein